MQQVLGGNYGLHQESLWQAEDDMPFEGQFDSWHLHATSMKACSASGCRGASHTH